MIPWVNKKSNFSLNSHWLPINAGVPQETKLGPILFLVMINNLSISDPESCTWKPVDDVSLSEGLVRNSNSIIQTRVSIPLPLGAPVTG